ncbi:EamA family transporter [Ferrovibrio sp.]|uniref:DMT family transporter n=1 Tax=Ferrovibrio sp. TaxID=1917215 RepID=UPI0025BC36C1|nr:EamA family transporter [Ferrovibrio sp.]MBX3453574.1 EamA family transporter [Ferrovibrio sp.]
MSDLANTTPQQATAEARSPLSATALLLLATLTLCWGINWPIMKLSLTEIPVYSFRAMCMAGGVAGLFAIGFARRLDMRVPRGYWGKLGIVSLFNITFWNILVLFGLAVLPAGRTSILAFTMPLWVVIISALVLGERLNAWRLAGLALGLTGLAVLVGGEWAAMAGAPIGVALVLSAAMSWAIGIVLIKKFQIPMNNVPFTAWQMLLGSIPIFIAAPLLESGQWAHWSAVAWSGVIYNALICFVLCYWIWNRLVTTLPAQISGLSTLMIPVVGVFSSMLMLGERPGWPEFTALSLIIMALVLVLKPSR